MTYAATKLSTVTTEYNGWSNRETWLASIWLSDDMDSYEFLQCICKRKCDTSEKAEALKAHFQEELDEMYDRPTFWTDILGTALDRVDWCQVVENNQ